MMKTVKAECSSCGGTGLYSGMCEAEGEAVVCLTCDGSGGVEIKYKPFTKRHGRKDIKTVRRSRGTFIAMGVGPKGEAITYAQFKAGKMP